GKNSGEKLESLFSVTGSIIPPGYWLAFFYPWLQTHLIEFRSVNEPAHSGLASFFLQSLNPSLFLTS
ncbi:MAG: hypothetical protein ACKO9H_05995, partial [Planctomycetota bacterium]